MGGWIPPVIAAVAVALAIESIGFAQPPQPGKTHGQAQRTTPIAAKVVSAMERRELLTRAAVWQPSPVPISQARLGGDGAPPSSCRFEITELGGTTRKFDCTLEDGTRLRVKYGQSGEIPSEVAAARLLRALGFGADHVTLVERLRCHGCPGDPFVMLKAVDLTHTEALYKKFVDYESFNDFTWVAVERRHRGRPIASEDLKGWSFFELATINPAKGGASRAHVDALRLLAVLLAHWDNKSENQRLVCVSEQDWPTGKICRRPFVMLQDVGAAFGPRKVDFDNWQRAPIWKDRQRCVTSMETLPYKGATFGPVEITEAGRRHLGDLLKQLSHRQLIDLFSGAGFDRHEGAFGEKARTAEEWATVFAAKVRQITEGPACPR